MKIKERLKTTTKCEARFSWIRSFYPKMGSGRWETLLGQLVKCEWSLVVLDGNSVQCALLILWLLCLF